MGHVLSTGGVDLVMALQQDGAARIQAGSTSHVNLYVNRLENSIILVLRWIVENSTYKASKSAR